MEFKNHDLIDEFDFPGVRFDQMPVLDPDGSAVDGLHATRITLDNPSQLNSYTTAMVKGVILGMRRASDDRRSVAVVFTGDACKNRAELVSRAADMTYDEEVTKASIEAIWSFWSRRPDSILVPGHDLPMVQEEGKVRYLGKREAAIRAWYGDDLNETTVISLLKR